MSRPPRLAERLLARFDWPDDHSVILGDLQEQFQERARTAGSARASLWYWREASRLVWGLWWWTPRSGRRRTAVMMTDDLRYAVRRLLRQPLTSAVSVLTLACAIGASAATWSLASAVLLHPLDVHEPERVVQFGQREETPSGPRIGRGFTYPTYRALLDTELMPFAALGAIGSATPLLIEGVGEERPRSVRYASHDLLDVLGLQPTLGRFFTESEDARGAPLVAVLADSFWRDEFGADPAVVGRVIRLNGHPVEIVGVGPEGFRGLRVGAGTHLFLPLHSIDQIEIYNEMETYDVLFGDHPPVYWINPIARLPEGVTLAQMQERFEGLQLDPARERTAVLIDAETAALSSSTRDELRQFSGLLGSTVSLLLTIGSLTVGMLLVMRTEARSAELATCLALGASRGRLAAGVAIEGVLLAAGSAVLAVPSSRLLFVGLRLFELPGGIRVDRLDLSMDGRLLVAIATAALASVVVMAGLASLIGVRRRLADVALRSQAGATPRITRRVSRSALVAAQVAVTLVLVTGAGLFARSVARALSLNPGIDTGRLVDVELDIENFGYDGSSAVALVEELQQRLRAHPAISSLGLRYSPWSGPVAVDGEELGLPSRVGYSAIDNDYFGTMGLRITAGRNFTPEDRAGAPAVAIVSEALARHIAGDGSEALGHRIVGGPNEEPAEIVGVATSIRSVGSLEPLRMYQPVAQYTIQQQPPYPGWSASRSLAIRAADDPVAAIGAVISTMRSIDPDIHLDPMATMETSVLDRMSPQRFGMTVMGTLGGIALFLSVLGTYVLAESMATLRRREIGVRAALGARGSQLRAMLLQDTLRLVGGGLLAGFFLSWLGADTIRAFLFQVEPFDPLVTGGVAVTIVLVALAVSLRPAFAATRLDLASVLRGD